MLTIENVDAMTDADLAICMSGGYGPEKRTALIAAIRETIRLARRQRPTFMFDRKPKAASVDEPQSVA